MKKVITIIVMAMVLLISPVWAEEEKKPATYEVRIVLVYNAASQAGASQLVFETLAKHGEDSCKTYITIRKNSLLLTFSDSSDSLYTIDSNR